MLTAGCLVQEIYSSAKHRGPACQRLSGGAHIPRITQLQEKRKGSLLVTVFTCCEVWVGVTDLEIL